jgi:predicted PurR-regulated permease PerM
MSEAGLVEQSQGKTTRIAYWFMLGLFIVMAWFHLATPFLVALLGYLALSKLHFVKGARGKWLAVVLFLVLVSGIAYGLGHLINQTIQALPKIAEAAIPSIIQWARQHQIELPFTDYDSLKDAGFDAVKSEVSYLGSAAKFARGAGSQFVLVVVGAVVAIGVFLNPRFELDRAARAARPNLYSACCDEIGERFQIFYRSFAMVMGAQISISAINTVLTAIFVAALQLPYALVVVGLTFLCGLLPVVGNLASNTIIVGIGFTVSPKVALIALLFLVLVHKLEYFLNGKIIGHRIRNPLWLTLLALVLGERLLGVPGMILAPVVLNYIKLEMSALRVDG